MLQYFTMRAMLVALAVWSMLPAAPALAWNGTGHETVAAIAYDNLTPKARATVDALLKAHPNYAVWIAGVTKVGDRGRVAFIRAATWPDDIKFDKRFYDDDDPKAKPTPTLPGYPTMKMHKDWHYVDYPFVTGTAKGSGPPAVTAVSVLGGLIDTVASTKASGMMRSYDLPWVIHLVGDIHQPLHCINHFSAMHPTGDLGGNEFKVAGPAKDLHAFWDDLLGKQIDVATIGTIESRLIGIYGAGKPHAFPAVMVKQLSPLKWSYESRDTARTFAYSIPEGSAGHPVPIPAAYAARAGNVGDRRISLAGYRLAAILNARLK